MSGKLSKILVGCIFAFSLVLICSVAMGAAQPAKIVGTKVNVRKEPNTSSGIITKLSNARVSVVDKSDGWYKISFDGKTGWVNSDYIEVLPVKGKINANGVNFRETASTSGKVIDSLSEGTSVEILDTLSGWHKVKIDKKVGYVASKFVTAVSTEQKSSRSTTAATLESKGIDDNKSSKDSNNIEDTDDSVENEVVAFAKKFVGVRYVYGGKTPDGFDCSGFVGYVYKNFGIELNSSSESMYSNGVSVSKSELKPGDLLFFDASSRKASGKIDHVGIYIGGGKFIHASTSNKQVIIQALSEYRGKYIGARRVL